VKNFAAKNAAASLHLRAVKRYLLQTDMILSIKLPLSLPAPSNLPMWNGIKTRMDIQRSRK